MPVVQSGSGQSLVHEKTGGRRQPCERADARRLRDAPLITPRFVIDGGWRQSAQGQWRRKVPLH